MFCIGLDVPFLPVSVSHALRYPSRTMPFSRLLVMWGFGSEQKRASPDDVRLMVSRRKMVAFSFFHTAKLEWDTLPERRTERPRGSYTLSCRCRLEARLIADL